MNRRELISKSILAFGGVAFADRLFGASRLFLPKQNNWWSPVEPTYTLWRTLVYTGSITDVTSTETRNSQSSQTITGKRYVSIAAVAVDMDNCTDMTFQNCAFVDIDEKAIDGFGCTNVLFEDCYFENCQTDIYFSTSEEIVVRNCWHKNMQGPPPNRGMAVQLNFCTGSNSIIECNYIWNETNVSDPQDWINIHESHFDSGSPCLIQNNYLYGKVTGTGSFSSSGGGINIEGQTTGSSYAQTLNNVLVRPGQYGVAIVSSHHCKANGNIIYSDNNGAGTTIPWANVGLLLYDYYNLGTCTANEYANNQIWWICGSTAACGSPGSHSETYFGGGPFGVCSSTSSSGNTIPDATLTVDEQPPACAAITLPTSTPTRRKLLTTP